MNGRNPLNTTEDTIYLKTRLTLYFAEKKGTRKKEEQPEKRKNGQTLNLPQSHNDSTLETTRALGHPTKKEVTPKALYQREITLTEQ